MEEELEGLKDKEGELGREREGGKREREKERKERQIHRRQRDLFHSLAHSLHTQNSLNGLVGPGHSSQHRAQSKSSRFLTEAQTLT